MLPIKHQSIFKSRWIALLWSAGIIWSALEFTGSMPTGGNDAGNNSAASDTAQPDNGSRVTSALAGAISTLQGLK